MELQCCQLCQREWWDSSHFQAGFARIPSSARLCQDNIEVMFGTPVPGFSHFHPLVTIPVGHLTAPSASTAPLPKSECPHPLS